jgi:ubiquinone/menaquinone biosynthesis C-methylase UbiE
VVEALWPDPAGVVKAVGMEAGMKDIDLCSGDGWFTLQVAKLVRHVVAIDVDPRLIEVARQRLSESGTTNCDLVVGSAYDVDKLVEAADYVFLANAFHGVPDPARLTEAVRRVLKPTGRFAIVNWHPRLREETTVLGEPRGPKTELRLSPKQTIEAVEGNGLEMVRCIEVPPYHYGVIFQRLPS